MAAKTINLAPDLQFSSIAAGQAHFDKILKDTPIDQPVTNAEFEAIKLLYIAYCRRTDWPLASQPKAFYPTHEQGPGLTTKCFGVEFEDGNTGRFSLKKALSAVAD